MKFAYVLLLFAATLMVFGCTQPSAPSGGGKTADGGTVPQIPGTVAPVEECTSEYSVSELQDGTLSETATLVVAATCSAGKPITVSLDGVEAATAVPESNEAQPVTLRFAPVKDGTIPVVVEGDGETIYTKDWTVKPLGSSDIKGLENDAVSFKDWRAMAVDVENRITPGRVKMFVKRLDFRTKPSTQVRVEIRDDDGGKPGEVVASVEKPMDSLTLGENWISFDFEAKPTLDPGKYWIVVRVDQTEDVSIVSDTMTIHYVAIDKSAPGNDYTSQMKLSVDSASGKASETSWAPLSYDRVYSIVLTSG
ncbi:MAG: choice-of-anchor R domain-containing protein [Candidatus Micrarchaeota archaeon]